MPSTNAIEELDEHWKKQYSDPKQLYSGVWWARLTELRALARPLVEQVSARVLASTNDPAAQQAERDRMASYEAIDSHMAKGYDEYLRWLAGVHAINAKYDQ